jgi:hypothetical protein
MFHCESNVKTLACFSAIQMSYVAFCGASIRIASQASSTSDNHFIFVSAEAEVESAFSNNSNVSPDFIVLFCLNISLLMLVNLASC